MLNFLYLLKIRLNMESVNVNIFIFSEQLFKKHLSIEEICLSEITISSKLKYFLKLPTMPLRKTNL